MLLITGLFLALVAVLVTVSLRAPARVDVASLGRMSEQWVAEYRASHSI
jgi:hypothetical protein